MNYVTAVIPAKTESRRVPGKNWRVLGKYSLVKHAVIFAEDVGLRHITVVSSAPLQGCAHVQYPLMPDGSEVDDSLYIWRHALAHTPGDDLSVLLEPACRRTSTAILRLEDAIDEFDGRTAIAIRPVHRTGNKGILFRPSGEFYLASRARIMDGSLYDGDLRYYLSDSMPIDTEVDWELAQTTYAFPL